MHLKPQCDVAFYFYFLFLFFICDAILNCQPDYFDDEIWIFLAYIFAALESAFAPLES